MSETLLASASRILWRTIRNHGIDANRLFEEAGLDPSMINDSSARFPIENARRAWSLAAESIEDPCFGIRAGEQWLSTDLHALGYAFLSSKDLLTAINRVVRYNEVVDEVIDFESAIEDDFLIVSYRNARDDLPDIAPLEDARWSTLLAMCRTAKGKDFCPVSAEFMHAGNGCSKAYKDFLGCTPRFNQARSALRFDLQTLRETLPAVNREVARINEFALDHYLESLHEGKLARKVEKAIIEHLASGDISDDKVAASLFMSARTLQRKLSEEGTGYKQLLEKVRQALAERYIRDERLSLNEISYLLGFAEQSSFSRAFKRWSGQSPSDVRGMQAD